MVLALRLESSSTYWAAEPVVRKCLVPHIFMVGGTIFSYAMKWLKFFKEIFENGFLPPRNTLAFAHMQVRVNMDADKVEDQVVYLYKYEGFDITPVPWLNADVTQS